MIEHLGRLAEADWEQLQDGEGNPYGALADAVEWRHKDHHTVERGADGRLLVSVGLVVVDVEAGEERFPVVGVGGVIVTHRVRGQGRLRPVLDAALERAGTLGAERAMLFCSRANLALYARFGFHQLPNPVMVGQPSGPVAIPSHAMWRPLRAGVAWPEGPVSLPGLPF